MKKRSVSVLWAAINIGSRSEWVIHDTISFLKRDAKEKYLNLWEIKHWDEALKRVRFSKVRVEIIE